MGYWWLAARWRQACLESITEMLIGAAKPHQLLHHVVEHNNDKHGAPRCIAKTNKLSQDLVNLTTYNQS
jgi:hypothetical protein